jgi:hypothetical protein
MMLDMGTGIAVAGIAIAAAPVAITALRVMRNGRVDTSTTTTTSTTGREKQTCSLHSGIEATLSALKDSMDVVQADIKELLKRG